MNPLLLTARPGMLLGEHPERLSADRHSAFDRRARAWFQRLMGQRHDMRGFRHVLDRIESAEKHLASTDTAGQEIHLAALRQQLVSGGLNPDHAIEAFAAIRVAARQVFGFDLHPEQLFAGWSMLHGDLAEMSTGEGKTLAAALPAIAVALTGTPVHVITVNEYLVERDAETLAPLYERFGLRVGTVTDRMNDDERRLAYRSDIVYCTNKQVVFDYLRDLQALKSDHLGLKSRIRSLLSAEPALPVLRGLCYAIVDEADSVMIDDARTPLILAEPWQVERTAVVEATVALSVARTLHEGADFRLQKSSRSVWLTETGLDALRRFVERLDGVWQFERYRNELVRQALCALHVYRLDRDYLVNDGRIELVDEATGRVTPDRKLQHGLHRMLEIKEKCAVSDDNSVVAALSFQRFFARYCHLAGMSGTLHEVRAELRQVYDVGVVRVPPHKANRRRSAPTLVLRDRAEQLEQVLREIRARRSSGQPVLLGTRSVALSEQLSDLLSLHDVPHTLLNARQDADEARVVAEAGQPGALTVATNMAGRGTDIPLQGNAAALGGLHVINLELNESGRVDRQLFGRSARQGDPGSCQSILSLHDELLIKMLPKRILMLADSCLSRLPTLGQWLAIRVLDHAQRRCELFHRSQRLTVFKEQHQLDRQLAIGGKRQ